MSEGGGMYVWELDVCVCGEVGYVCLFCFCLSEKEIKKEKKDDRERREREIEKKKNEREAERERKTFHKEASPRAPPLEAALEGQDGVFRSN